MHFSALLRSHLIQFHEEQQLHTENTVDISDSRFTRLRIGFFASPSSKFCAQISSDCSERLFRTHERHFAYFEPSPWAALPPHSDGEVTERWCIAQRGVELTRTVTKSYQEKEWGLDVQMIHEQQRRGASSISPSWLGIQCRHRCFMLDCNLRLTLSETKLQFVDSLRMPQFTVSLDMLSHLETMNSQRNESSEQYVDRVVLPALQSVLQMLQESHLPISSSTQRLVDQAFLQLTGSPFQLFVSTDLVLLESGRFDDLFKSSNTNINVMLTDKIHKGKPACVYIHEDIVYLYTEENGLRQITQRDSRTADWNGTVLFGESDGQNTCGVMDICWYKGRSMMEEYQKSFAERMDLLTTCHTDLCTIYRRPPFEVKTYSYCRSQLDIHHSIHRMFQRFEERGPHTMGGVYIVQADKPYSHRMVFWEPKLPFRLRIGSACGDTLYASGPNNTTCLVEDVEMAPDLPYVANQIGLFRFSQGDATKLDVIGFERDEEVDVLTDIADVVSAKRDAPSSIDQVYLEHGATVLKADEKQPLMTTPAPALAPAVQSFRPVAVAVTPSVDVTTTSAPVPRRKRKAPTLSDLFRPIPKQLKIQ